MVTQIKHQRLVGAAAGTNSPELLSGSTTHKHRPDDDSASSNHCEFPTRDPDDQSDT